MRRDFRVSTLEPSSYALAAFGTIKHPAALTAAQRQNFQRPARYALHHSGATGASLNTGAGPPLFDR
jgi:hypothetical protein